MTLFQHIQAKSARVGLERSGEVVTKLVASRDTSVPASVPRVSCVSRAEIGMCLWVVASLNPIFYRCACGPAWDILATTSRIPLDGDWSTLSSNRKSPFVATDSAIVATAVAIMVAELVCGRGAEFHTSAYTRYR
jgi:hypothetical protein